MTTDRTIAVIGAGYGDEGKGLATDYFARSLDVEFVARGNGGAQAGHTVVDGEKRHVFGHFSAGTFAGASTFLGSSFIVNPQAFIAEAKTLHKIQTLPQVYAHRDCKVTTIWDMAINALVELKRGGGRHGSCGFGINETVTRDLAGYQLRFGDFNGSLSNPTLTLQRIKREWIPQRLEELGLTEFLNSDQAFPYAEALRLGPVQVRGEMEDDFSYIRLMPASLGVEGTNVVIEGAQGLMLDEYLGNFPHVTRSITGLPSAIKVAAEMGRKEIEPVYMTRCYVTRHGAGYLSGEGAHITAEKLHDATNQPNEWQGTLRYAPLNVPHLTSAIQRDLARSQGVAQLFGIEIKEPKLFVTCLDQVKDDVTIYGNRGSMSVKQLLTYLNAAVLPISHISYGPTANDVQEWSYKV